VSSLPKAINAIYPLKQFGKDALNKNKPEDLPNEYINSFRVKSRDCKKWICPCITFDNFKKESYALPFAGQLIMVLFLQEAHC
jgi:hypothetical protein